MEDDGKLNKYLGIELFICPDGSINIRKSFFTQIIINMILYMDKAISKPTPGVKNILEKTRDLNQ